MRLVKQNKDCYYFELDEKEYISGQTWCIQKKQHVFLDFSILFLIGIIGELYYLISYHSFSNIIWISVISIIFCVIANKRAKKIARRIYDEESKKWSISVNETGFEINDCEKNIKIYFYWDQIKKIFCYKDNYVIYITKTQYFFIPTRIIDIKELKKYAHVYKRYV